MNTRKLRNSKLLAPIIALRDWLMRTFHIFALKAKIKRWWFITRLKIEDRITKRKIRRAIYAMPDGLLPAEITTDDIILSLTSYGKRVMDTLPYAIYSMLTQSVKPKKIVVYLDEDHWSDAQLPDILVKLLHIGVEFYYCEDLRSYKKLIPALTMFPDNPIITLDDDFYYHPNYLEWMTEAYNKSDKKTILGQWGCQPQKEDGKFIPYTEWKDGHYDVRDEQIAFYGCCCCYPPHIFDDEILKKELFMKLCPTADDIWFWAMEERQHIQRAYIKPAGYGYNIYVNRCEEYWESIEHTLMYENVQGGKNNSQLRAVVDYYGLEK